jgi:hypothetical protein
MARRLRPDARVFASVSLVTALTAAGLDRFPLAAQPGPTDVAALLERVSSYVQAYYTRAQSLMVEETVVVQPVKGDLAPDGFARSLLFDLRFEWTPGQGDEKPRVQVVRELLRANHRPAKPKDEPKCLDPEPITPEPLEFLLPGHHDDYTFAGGALTVLDGRAAILLEYTPRSSGTPKATLDPKGTGDKDCLSMDVPRRFRGRIWVDPETAAVRRIDETLMGPTDVPLPREALRRNGFGGGLYVTLSRSDSSVRYAAVSFADPEETLMLPTSIENVWVTIAGGARGVRMTQQYRNYRRFLTQSRILQE